MNQIEIMDVCPRDGWQNLKEWIAPEKKLEYIRGLLHCGIRSVQMGSFVSPKAIPQMASSGELARKLTVEYPDVFWDALVPNLKGAELASAAGIRHVSYVMSVSESHNQANIGRTHQQSLDGLKAIRDAFPDLDVSLALATSFGCPFEGETPFERVEEYVEYGVQLGLTRVELSDTIGSAAPQQVIRAFGTLSKRYPQIRFIAHMHDTRNNGVLNGWLAAEHGASVIHTALGGLGGCPFAPGASGNTSTEDLVYLLERSGVRTGVDCSKIIDLAKQMRAQIEGVYSGHQISILDDCYEKACQTRFERKAE